MSRSIVLFLAIASGAALGAGCRGGDALVEISAADALDAISAQTRLALDEFHADLGRADDAREAGIIAAFVRRARRDAVEDEKMAVHTRDFTAALGKLRADRETAWQRHFRAIDNVDRIDEVAGGLRRLARQSVSLSDEWDRYLGSLIEARRKARQPAPTPAPRGATP